MAKLSRSSLSADAYTAVRNLLLGGVRYEPGAKIIVEELSRELGVSRTPIWGAINRLEAEGVVEIVPRLGVYLLGYDTERAGDTYVAREALEGMATRLAATWAGREDLEILQRSIRTQAEHLKARDFERYAEAAMAFHVHILTASRSLSIGRLLGSIYAQIQVMRVRARYSTPKLPASVKEHESILDALRARDPERAEREARAHVQTLRAQIDQPPETPRRRAPRSR
jgi:DNA-binding GntR family transcriptional regulator